MMAASSVLKKSNGTQTIFWWVVWISLTIASFFAASSFWTPFIAKHCGSILETRNAAIWICAVFGTWMIFLVPLIVLMYQKVDKAYEDARIRREKAASRFRSIHVEKSKRLLAPELRRKMAGWPETIKGGHLVKIVLKDGRQVAHAFVSEGEILGVYDLEEFSFTANDVADIQSTENEALPAFSTTQWLRLDGVKPSE